MPAAMLLALVAESAAATDSDDHRLPAGLRSFLTTFCLDCHDGPKGKGGLDLAAPLLRGELAEGSLRALRRRLAKRDMPPADEEARPGDAEYAAVVRLIDAIVPPPAREVPNVRRLNRAQHEAAVRDVLGVHQASAEHLPRDEIGEGFDTTGDTLALPPLLLEKYFDAAEAIAAAAVPDDAPRRIEIRAERLRRTGQGELAAGLAWLWSPGTLDAPVEVARAGRHRISIDAAGQQAGEELVRLAIEIDGRRVHVAEVAAERARPMRLAWEGELVAGRRSIAVRFLNDFHDPTAPASWARDRNLGVGAIVVEGPLDPAPPSAFERRVAAMPGVAAGSGSEATRLGRIAAAIGGELFRRPLTKSEAEALVATAREAAGRKSSWKAQLRALVTALLVDPRFLLRVEPPAAGGGTRSLSGDEVASRLSFFLWSSVPDEALQSDARDGSLSTPEGVALAARRMLGDPRASTLATRFAAQWLGIDGLPGREVDPTLYPHVDAALLESMRRETELLFEQVVRGDSPVRSLLAARTTMVDARLAQHYGFVRASAADGAFVPVELPAGRPGGILGHGSILLATSNPTRTSPVKRGKWVLDALLDEAPPPPPPGVPQLPETTEERQGLAIRELMAMHRANPDCASCHVRMDAIGLAFERLDVDGRLRVEADGAAIDDRSELPDGSLLDGLAGIDRHLAAQEGFERSLARRLLVYALGRGTAEADDELVERLAADLRREGRFATLVEGIVRSDAFRTRTDFPKPPPR